MFYMLGGNSSQKDGQVQVHEEGVDLEASDAKPTAEEQQSVSASSSTN